MTYYKTLQQSNIESIKIEVLYSIETAQREKISLSDCLICHLSLLKFLYTLGWKFRLFPVFWLVSVDQRECNQIPGVELFRTHSEDRWFWAREVGSSFPFWCPWEVKLSWKMLTDGDRRPGSCLVL